MRTALLAALALLVPCAALAAEPVSVKPLTNKPPMVAEAAPAPVSLRYGHDAPSGENQPGVRADWRLGKRASLNTGLGAPGLAASPGGTSGSMGFTFRF